MKRSKLARIPEGFLSRDGQITPGELGVPEGMEENVVERAQRDPIAARAMSQALLGRAPGGRVTRSGQFVENEPSEAAELLARLTTPIPTVGGCIEYVPGRGHLSQPVAGSPTSYDPNPVKSKEEQGVGGTFGKAPKTYDLNTPEGCKKAFKAGDLDLAQYHKRLEEIAKRAEADEGDDLDDLDEFDDAEELDEDDDADDSDDSDDADFDAGVYRGSPPGPSLPARRRATSRTPLF